GTRQNRTCQRRFGLRAHDLPLDNKRAPLYLVEVLLACNRREKMHRAISICFLSAAFSLAAFWGFPAGAQTLPLKGIKLPPGFEISIYASNVPNARSLALSPKGVLFVGSVSAGSVYAVVYRNGDHVADQVFTLARRLNMPNGVAYRDGALYV